MRKINCIIVHCSYSPHGREDNAATIHNWHTERGFDGIGYHYVILEDGTIERGRPEYWVGAHCRGANNSSIGICLIGNREFTDDQFKSLVDLIDDIQSRHPFCHKVYGHSYFDDNKSCPNFNVNKVIATVKEGRDPCLNLNLIP